MKRTVLTTIAAANPVPKCKSVVRVNSELLDKLFQKKKIQLKIYHIRIRVLDEEYGMGNALTT